MGQENTGFEALFEAWIKSATGLWNAMAQSWTSDSGSARKSPTAGGPNSNRTEDSIDAILKMWRAASSTMNEPGTLYSLFEGFNTLPEIFLNMAQKGLERSFRLQAQWMENAGKIGRRTEAYSYENLDEEIHRAWTEIYGEEFRKFLNVPQLGLTRFYQERVARLIDRYNVFQNALSHFVHVLYLPMEKSGKALQDEIEAMAREKKLPDNSQEYYRRWIKILEGHYMTLFKSPEYTRVLHQTLNAMEDFMEARQDVLQDLLQTLPVPTQKEMDELYKELYLLKKKVRQLEKKSDTKSPKA